MGNNCSNICSDSTKDNELNTEKMNITKLIHDNDANFQNNDKELKFLSMVENLDLMNLGQHTW